jgi:hypothetical protein
VKNPVILTNYKENDFNPDWKMMNLDIQPFGLYSISKPPQFEFIQALFSKIVSDLRKYSVTYSGLHIRNYFRFRQEVTWMLFRFMVKRQNT